MLKLRHGFRVTKWNDDLRLDFDHFWIEYHSGLPHGHGQKFWNFIFKMNFGNIISMLWNPEIQNFIKFWWLLYKLWGFLFRFSLIFDDIIILFDQSLKGHNYWTKCGKDPNLFLIEPWHVKFWFMKGKTRKKLKFDCLVQFCLIKYEWKN
jgi:hypothetical protein